MRLINACFAVAVIIFSGSGMALAAKCKNKTVTFKVKMDANAFLMSPSYVATRTKGAGGPLAFRKIKTWTPGSVLWKPGQTYTISFKADFAQKCKRRREMKLVYHCDKYSPDGPDADDKVDAPDGKVDTGQFDYQVKTGLKDKESFNFGTLTFKATSKDYWSDGKTVQLSTCNNNGSAAEFGAFGR